MNCLVAKNSHTCIVLDMIDHTTEYCFAHNVRTYQCCHMSSTHLTWPKDCPFNRGNMLGHVLEVRHFQANSAHLSLINPSWSTHQQHGYILPSELQCSPVDDRCVVDAVMCIKDGLRLRPAWRCVTILLQACLEARLDASDEKCLSQCIKSHDIDQEVLHLGWQQELSVYGRDTSK